MSPSQQPIPTNPSYLKNQFAHRFIRALRTLNYTKPSSSHDHNKLYRRSTRVKIAAYTAMASVVGSRRAWSRAVLWKIRKRSRNQGLLLRKIKVLPLKRRNPNPRKEDFNPFRNSIQESKLRKLVPGAKTMDSWCLIGETADYIKCLVAQVEVMKTLVDLYSST